MSVINVARRQAKGYYFALIIDDQVQLEAVEPAHGGLASCGSPSKHPVLVDAWVTADHKRCRIDKADAGTATQLRMQPGYQRNQDRGHQLDEALIAHQRGKLTAQVARDVRRVIHASTSSSGTDGTG